MGRITDGCDPELSRLVRGMSSVETAEQYISVVCQSPIEFRDRGIMAADEVMDRGWAAWDLGRRARPKR